MRNFYARVLLVVLLSFAIRTVQAAPQLPLVGDLIVTITSPTAGSTVKGNITVNASVGPLGVLVAGVQFKLDGANLGAEDGSAPYSVPWNTVAAANGVHTLTAVARNALGLRFNSDPVTVTVDNDKTPPLVVITAPASGSTVNGTITVSAGASDNVAVAGVQFRLDGVNFGNEDTSTPYSVSWDTLSAANGSHTWTAVARDTSGNQTSSASVTVSVLNDRTPPTVVITSPSAGSTVSGTIPVNADATDDIGVAAVQFKLDGANFGAEDTTPPYSVGWDTRTAGNGTHTLTAVARDNAGKTSTSAAVTVTVSNTPPTSGRFEETDPSVSTTGSWVHGNSQRAWSGGTADVSVTAGARATFTFTGTSVSWIGFRGPQAGIAQVFVDGVAAAEIDMFASNEQLQANVFRTNGLAPGTHTLTVEVTGRQNPAASAPYVVVDAFEVNPPSVIEIENQRQGSGNWQMWLGAFRPADDVQKQVKGYASATSVNKGEAITFHITVNPSQTFTMDVYRMGWYQGLGGRLMQHIGPQNGVTQPACPVDSQTGRVECAWTASYTLNIPVDWTSGVYLVQLTNAQGYQNYIDFVVRDDSRRADILYQQSVTTYQAYNNYPNDGVTGKSLYEYNSHGPNTLTGTPRAVKVSFNRPFSQDGSGQFLSYEYYFVRWLERSGYDVSYSTDLDTHRNGAKLLDYKAFLSVGHDEYWSKAMFDAAEQARDAGVHLAFFGANAIFWQVRFEPSPVTGAANRVMVGYKDASLDPVQDQTTTVNWRNPQLNRPEQSLMGVQYSGELHGNPNVPYVVTNSSNWMYAASGFVDGDSVPGIVGYEADSSMTTAPLPNAVAGTYQILSQSPFIDNGRTVVANSSIYQAPGGAWVFGAGTICWSWGLDYPGLADPRIQRTTGNLLNRFLGIWLP